MRFPVPGISSEACQSEPSSSLERHNRSKNEIRSCIGWMGSFGFSLTSYKDKNRLSGNHQPGIRNLGNFP